MEQKPQLWKVQDKRRFLIEVMQELAGEAKISFEGKLSRLQLSQFDGASMEESASLKRNTLSPIQDFVVLPLAAELIPEIIRAIGGTVPKTILHIQIEKSGRLEVGLYDQFDPEAMAFGDALSAEFFDGLQAQGILKRWRVK